MQGTSRANGGAGRPRRSQSALTLVVLLLGTSAASGGESLQPGFYYHDPGNLRLTEARSGLLCSDEGDPRSVCEAAHRIVITGRETCDYSPDKRYPCTRFGYEFDYDGATPGTTLDCTVRRSDPRGRSGTDDYTHRLDKESGHVFHETFRTYAPVEERLIFTEVHDCAYQGERLSTIEFLIHYEPGTEEQRDAGDGDPYFPEIPNACSGPYLTERTAEGLLNANAVRRHAASEHIPDFWSQCIYKARGGQRGRVSYVFKFMLSDMYDVDKVDRRQITFNATFGAGDAPLREVREDLGDLAFVFEEGNRTTLFMITGIKGPKDGAGRSQEFIANYYIEHPDLSHEDRLVRLVEQAKLHLRHWYSEGA